MSLEGRKELRIALNTPVYLIRTGDALLPDLATTENVSSYGARVISNRPCRVGEDHRISPFPGEYHLKATVVYCTPRPNNQYCIGLKLQFAFTDWWTGVFGQRRPEDSVRPRLYATAADAV